MNAPLIDVYYHGDEESKENIIIDFDPLEDSTAVTSKNTHSLNRNSIANSGRESIMNSFKE
jgi:hypothetical protein